MEYLYFSECQLLCQTNGRVNKPSCLECCTVVVTDCMFKSFLCGSEQLFHFEAIFVDLESGHKINGLSLCQEGICLNIHLCACIKDRKQNHQSERQLLHCESSEELDVRFSCSRMQIQMVTSSQCRVRSALLQAVYLSMFMSKKSTIKEISQKYLEKFYTNILFCKLINNRSHLPTPITPLCVE